MSQGFRTLLYSEWIRFKGVISQTAFPSIVTNILYLVIIGMSIGKFVPMEGVTYLEFLVPGLIMMGMITNAYSGGSGTLFFQRFLGHITNLLSVPLKTYELIFAYLYGGILRGATVGIATWILSLFFIGYKIHNLFLIIYFSFFVMVLFSSLGIITGLVIKEWEHLGAISTFIITPLTFFGGVFHSIKMLPPVFYNLSLYNPFVYMVDGLRYSFLGVNDVAIGVSMFVVALTAVLSLIFAYYLFDIGHNIKT